MKTVITRTLQILALLIALAIPAFSEESNRGLYEGNLAGGGKVVFFLQGNHSISAYVFDTAGHQASFAGGKVNSNGSFSLTTNTGGTITGTLSGNTITATLLGQNITATRTPIFGSTADIAGRFVGFGHSSGGMLGVKIIVDSQGNIFFIGTQGTNVIGGFGTVTIQRSNGSGDDDEDDDDEKEDRNEDSDSARFTGTFNITGLNGETIAGNLTFGHGTISGSITINGTTFRFNCSRESAFNHLANISTRGFVNTGQGQLIGGFIIRGGPKLVLIRALGPTLAAFGISPVLADPKVQLFQNQTLLRENNDWQSAANASEITATTIPPTNSKESAILIRLEPGNYTTVVTGADGGTGIALVEVYEIDRD
jgi:hypothetical protein